MNHAWHELGKKPEKTDTDKALIAAVIHLSVTRYTKLTMEEIYDKLLEQYAAIAE